MSESKLIIPAIGKVLAKVESTSGTKEALTDSEAVFFEEIEWQYESDNLQRLPLAPERHGVRSVEGPTRISWSGSTEMALPDQFAASAMSAPPHPDVWLRSCGFAREDFSSAAHEVAFYALQSTNHESISFEAYEYTADGADADYVQARGALRQGIGWDIVVRSEASFIRRRRPTGQSLVASCSALEENDTQQSRNQSQG